MDADRCRADLPSLSIVIPSHNRPDLLRRCLASVDRFAPQGTQIIVVDDASADASVSRVAAEFSGVHVVRLQKQSGFCVASNRGIAAAQGDVIELLNDDTVVEEGWAKAGLVHFHDPRVAAVAPLVMQMDGSPIPRIDSAGDCYHLGGFAGKRGRGKSVAAFAPRPDRVFGASASSAFYRRTALLAVGAFPEAFGSYFEDVDLSFRLRRFGLEIVFEPESRVWHRVNGSYGKPDRRLLMQQSRNEERVFWRNIPASQLWRAVPLHAAVLLAKAWRRWREGQFLPFAIGRMQAVAEFEQIIQHRRRLAKLGPANALTPVLECRLRPIS